MAGNITDEASKSTDNKGLTSRQREILRQIEYKKRLDNARSKSRAKPGPSGNQADNINLGSKESQDEVLDLLDDASSAPESDSSSRINDSHQTGKSSLEREESYARELNRKQRQERRGRARDFYSRGGEGVKSAAKEYAQEEAKRAAKQAAKKAATAIGRKVAQSAAAQGTRAAAAALAANPVTWVVVGILILIALFFGFVMLVASAPIALCTEGGATGELAGLASAIGKEFGMIDSDVCMQVAASMGASQVMTDKQACDAPGMLQELAQINNTPYPNPRNAPELDALISCISSKVPASTAIRKYTFDENHRTCNFTRGDPICEPCSHAINSCHYGGTKSPDASSPRNQGSLAVDYAVVGALANQIIKAANECGAKTTGSIPGARCENSAGKMVTCTSPAATHVHITSASCDRN